jgi:hypothetical protein
MGYPKIHCSMIIFHTDDIGPVLARWPSHSIPLNPITSTTFWIFHAQLFRSCPCARGLCGGWLLGSRCQAQRRKREATAVDFRMGLKRGDISNLWQFQYSFNGIWDSNGIWIGYNGIWVCFSCLNLGLIISNRILRWFNGILWDTIWKQQVGYGFVMVCLRMGECTKRVIYFTIKIWGTPMMNDPLYTGGYIIHELLQIPISYEPTIAATIFFQ